MNLLLKGHIKYQDKETGNVYHYNVEGVDTSGSLNLTLSNPITSTMQYLDPHNYDLAYTSKRIQIKGTTMRIESEKDYTNVDPNDEKPKLKRFRPNVDFFARLGTLIRYIKTNCVNKNSTLKLETGVFDAKISTEYQVQVGEQVAKVTLDYSLLSFLSFKGYGFDIELRNETSKSGYVAEAYQTTKENVQITFKKSDFYELFGIPEPKVFKLDFDNINGESDFYSNIDEIIKAHPDKDFSWLFGRKYEIVTDDTLEEVVQYLSQFDVLAMDTETTGLKITFKSRTGETDECVGIILTGKEGESFYFPMKHTKFDNLCGGDDWYFMEKYIKPLLTKKRIVVHNASFDWKVCYIYGIPTNVFFDTQVAFAVTLKAKYGESVSLKSLTALLLKRDSLELDDLCINGDFSSVDETFADLPYELVRLYACPDADNTLGLYHYIVRTKLLEEYNAVKVTQFESIFACAIGYSEFHGQFIDVNKTDELVSKIEEDSRLAFDGMIRELQKVGYDVSNFNPNSNPQKLEIVYKVLKCPEQTNKQGKVTADKHALKRLAEMTDAKDKPLYPFVVELQKYNEMETIRKNFTKNLPNLFTADGFSFPSVDQFKTTGRVSTKDPNYQGYSDTVKKYIQPRPGTMMFDCDYASIEYRVIASMSKQESLMKAFIDPNMDYHKLQASNMYNVPYELVSGEMRRNAKPFNFGIPFGMGDGSLGVLLKGEFSPENTKYASKMRRKYFKNQENVEQFFKDAQNDAVKFGFTETHFGRRRYYNKETTSVGSIKRQGGNQRIQGTAADIYKQAVVRLFLRIINDGLLDKVFLTGFIHDELLQEVSMEIHPLEWMKILKEEMELVIEDFCPIYLGMGVGRSWYEAKKTEIPTELQSQLQGNLSEFPNWHGNLQEFAEWIPKRIDQFEEEYVDKFITHPDNQGQVISSITYDYLTNQSNRLQDEYLVDFFNKYKGDAVIKLDFVTYSMLMNRASKLVKKLKTRDSTVEDYIQAFCKKNKIGLSDCEIDISDVTTNNVLDFSDLQILLDYYCSCRGIDRARVNILSPHEVKVDTTDDESENSEFPTFSTYYEEETDEEKAKKIFLTKLTEYGSHLNVSERIAYFKYSNASMDVVKKYINKNEEGYKIVFVDIANDKEYVTKSYITSKNLMLAQRELLMVGV